MMLRLLAHMKDSSDGSRKHVHKVSTSQTVAIINEPKHTRDSSSSCSTSQSTEYVSVGKGSVPSWHRDSKYIEYEPRLIKTTWELERHKRKPLWSRSVPEKEVPTYTPRKLPTEVYECIIAQLEDLHLGNDQACSTCHLRDLHSLALTNRAWERVARPHLYHKIYVVTGDEHPNLPRLKIKEASKLKLLRRTLRHRGALARYVRELHLSDFQTLYQDASIEREEITNLVASLVLACPLLERVVGFHAPFTHSFDRLSYALSTRPNLKERVWLLSEPETDGAEEEDAVHQGHYVAAHDPTERFLELNSRNPTLTTLVLHQESNRAASLNFRAMVGTFQQIPTLRHLAVSGLPAISFTNVTLNALPQNLQSLRLDNLPGINDKGLQRFMTSSSASSIEKLTLVNLEVASLVTISNILSEHLGSLKQFSLVQYKAPSIMSRAAIPDFNSSSLQYIHFELRSQAGPIPTSSSKPMRTSSEQPPFPFTNAEPISCLAISLLATSIQEGAFPSLRRIRIPHDPQGVIQSLCKPRATALEPSDRYLLASPSQPNHSFTSADQPATYSPTTSLTHSFTHAPSPRADSAIGSPTFSHASIQTSLTPKRSRLAAQSRITAARQTPCFTLRVHDPEGQLCVETSYMGYMGDFRSKILYDLLPDREWPQYSEDVDGDGALGSVWISGVEDLVDERARSREQVMGRCGHLVGRKGMGGKVRVAELF